MNAEHLWQDHTFHVLLGDLVKAKGNEQLGPIRLQAVLDYAEKKAVVQAAPHHSTALAVVRQPEEEGPAPGFQHAEEDELTDPPATVPAKKKKAPAKAQSTAAYLRERIAARPQPGQVIAEAVAMIKQRLETA